MGAGKSRMTFFVASKGLGRDEDLADLEKADAHCQALAINAIDRIGKGPWYNAEAELVAADREEVRAGARRLTKDTALTERGDPVEDLSGLRRARRFYCFGID